MDREAFEAWMDQWDEHTERDRIKMFAAWQAAGKHEREACAKLCYVRSTMDFCHEGMRDSMYLTRWYAAREADFECAATIWARNG